MSFWSDILVAKRQFLIHKMCALDLFQFIIWSKFVITFVIYFNNYAKYLFFYMQIFMIKWAFLFQIQ